MSSADSRFELISIEGIEGAVVGDHHVAITTGQRDLMTDEVITVETLPARYNRDTELQFVVPQDGTTDAVFELTSTK